MTAGMCLLLGVIVTLSKPALAEEAGPGVAVYGELSSVVIASRASANVSVPVCSFAQGKLHLMANAGLGGMSYHFEPAFAEVHATAGLLTGAQNHHAELQVGAARVSNTLSNTGGHGYRLLSVGYRYQRPGAGLMLTASLGTLGLGVGAGWAF